MKRIKIDEFINRYELLYYKPERCPDSYKRQHYGTEEGLEEKYKELLKKYLGLSELNATDYRAEEKVVELLEASTFNEISLAWKSGKVGWDDKLNKIKSDNERNNCYINGYGNPIVKSDFKDYIDELEDKRDDINKLVEAENWEEAYKKVNENSPKNIGPVYNINTLFFVTGGKAPIYDKYAHKAIKALLLDISPDDVYLGINPGKSEFSKVIAMYQEYMTILKMLFKEWIKNEKGMFISRELDRALWVYGHSKLRY